MTEDGLLANLRCIYNETCNIHDAETQDEEEPEEEPADPPDDAKPEETLSPALFVSFTS